MKHYEYRVTETLLVVRRAESDPLYYRDHPHLNWRDATEQERQLPQPGPEWRLSNSFSDKQNTAIVCIWERVVGETRTGPGERSRVNFEACTPTATTEALSSCDR